MTFAGWAQIVIFLIVLTLLTPLVGSYLARVTGAGEPNPQCSAEMAQRPSIVSRW